MVSHILIAMKREIPDYPTPYPFYKSSSNIKTMIPAKVN